MILQRPTAASLRTTVDHVQAMGFDGLWLADHLTELDGGGLLDPVATLGMLAERTEGLALGLLVANITYRHPALLARAALTIDHLAGDRFELGVGAAGTRAGDGDAAGVDPWSTAERVDRFVEFVDALVALWGPSPAHDGRWYRSSSVAEGPHRSGGSRPPLVVAAQGRRTLAVAAARADCWSVLGGWPHQGEELVAHVASLSSQLDELCDAVGRDPAGIRRSLLVGGAGIRWWDSLDAFDDFVGRFGEAGITEYVVYAPPVGPPGWETRFFDFMPLAIERAHAGPG